MKSPDAMPFRPLRVLAVDLASGEVEYPDPDVRPPHPEARVLVRWLGDPLGLLQVAASDADAPGVVRQEAWRLLQPELVAAATRRGLPAPSRIEDLAVGKHDCPTPSAFAETPLVTVTVASFRNVDSTVKCVRRILLTEWPELEVLVVDNDVDPTDLRQALKENFSTDGRVRWVHEPRQGLSFARNAGLDAARGKIVVFTDDDVLVDRRWIERMVSGFQAAEKVGCVTGAILPAEVETPAQLWLEEYGGFHKGYEAQVFNSTTDRSNSPLFPYNAGQFGSGANMAFQANVLRTLGGFAVDLGAGTPAHGGEDLDIFLRTIFAGHTIVYEPAALMWHRHRRSFSALRRQMFRYGIGLSATVTKWILDSPRQAKEIFVRVPGGLLLLFVPKSDKNKRKSASFPPVLTALELAGVLFGPVAYLRSRRRAKRLLARSPRSKQG